MSSLAAELKGQKATEVSSLSISSPSANSNPRPAGRKPRGARTDRIPRAPNAFICFRSFYNSITRSGNNNHNNGNGNGNDQCSVSRAAGDAWRRLPEKEKSGWYAMASEIRVEHSRLYPGYQYRPVREKRNRKNTGVQSANEVCSWPKEVSQRVEERWDEATCITGEIMEAMYGRRGNGGLCISKRIPASVRNGDPRRWTQVSTYPNLRELGLQTNS